MKRFSQPARHFSRLHTPFATRTVAVGLFISYLFLFCGFASAAQPLVPKREVPKRKQVQISPQQIVWPNQDQKPVNYAISKDSLIQQVMFEEEASGIVVPPAPTIRRSVQPEPFGPINDTLEPELIDDLENDIAETDSTESPEEPGEFAPLDVSEYEFPQISDANASSAANETPTVSPPTALVPSGSPLNAAANLSGGGLINVPQQQFPAQQYAQQYAQPQYSQNQANPYWNPNQTQQTAHGYNPYYASSYGTAYVNPYGYGYYGYPNTPGAYWGPTGFVSNPYAAYPGYNSPYGYRALPKNAEDDEKKSSESLSSTTWETLGYFNPLKSPKGPNRGVGGPLMMRSWRDRPFYLGVFGGGMSGGELISDLVDQDTGGTGGIIFGWYCDNYWGLESRLHFAGVPSKDTAAGRAVYEEWYKAQGDDSGFIPPLSSRNNAISMFDVSMHYYPLGNAKWRPFLKLGLGSVNQKFRDIYGVKHSYNSFSIPWGIGLKYWWNERVALQMELTDNVIFAVEEAKTQNNVALTVGLNFPIGKIKRKDPVVYWPITPSSGR